MRTGSNRCSTSSRASERAASSELSARMGMRQVGFTHAGSSALLRLELPQVVQVGLAVGAADDIEVEADVIEQFLVARAEQKAAQLIASGATDAFAPPDGPGGVLAAIFLVEHF